MDFTKDAVCSSSKAHQEIDKFQNTQFHAGRYEDWAADAAGGPAC